MNVEVFDREGTMGSFMVMILLSQLSYPYYMSVFKWKVKGGKKKLTSF